MGDFPGDCGAVLELASVGPDALTSQTSSQGNVLLVTAAKGRSDPPGAGDQRIGFFKGG